MTLVVTAVTIASMSAIAGTPDPECRYRRGGANRTASLFCASDPDKELVIVIMWQPVSFAAVTKSMVRFENRGKAIAIMTSLSLI